MRPIEILQRAVWDPKFKKLKDFVIVIKHRGAPGDKREILGEKIINIQKDGFWYANELDEEIFIPAHRIIEIKEK